MIGALIAKQNVPLGVKAFNQRDLDSYLGNWTDDEVLVYPGDIPGISGAHEGKPTVRDFYQQDFEQFPILQVKPIHVGITNLFDLTGNNVVITNWEADATNRD